MNKKQSDFLINYKFKESLLLIWSVWVWKSFLMEKLEKKILNWKYRNNSWIDCYWIDDWEFREKITSWQMTLKPIESSSSITSFPLNMCIRAKVLFFDDLWSSENVSKAQITKFKYILDERIKRNLPTIFSTNLNPWDLEELYWERIKSRLFLNTVVFEMKWEDKRKANTIFL